MRSLSEAGDIAVAGEGERDISRRNRDIEALRAFAVLAVVFHHTAGVLFSSWSPAIFDPFALGSGVDLFFVISGYVIGRSLLPRLYNANTSSAAARTVIAFWTRRIFRLWPTALFWLVAILAITATFSFSAPHLNFKTNVDAGIAGALNFANIRFAESFGAYAYGASFHYWTLSLEEQFYLLLPLLVLLTRRAWILASVIVLLMLLDQLRAPSLLSISTRVTALFSGVLIAMWSFSRSHRHLSRWWAWISRWVRFPVMLVAVILVPWVAGATSTITPFHFGYVAVAGAFCVVLASFDRDALCLPGPWGRFMMWTGSRSYALYVAHVPIFLIANEISKRLFDPTQIDQMHIMAAVGVSGYLAVIVLAELNYRIIEAPLRKVGAGLAKRLEQEV